VINWYQGLLELIIKYWSCLPLTSKQPYRPKTQKKKVRLLPADKKEKTCYYWDGDVTQQ